MSIQIIQLHPLDPSRATDGVSRCPRCRTARLQRWQQVRQADRHPPFLHSTFLHFRCTQCGKTFRTARPCEPQEVSKETLHNLATLMWVLGLSLNEIQALFSDCDLAVSHAALWRHGKELIRLLPEGRRSRLVELIPGESRDLITRASRTGAVVSLESGEAPRVVLELVDEADLTEVRSWLPPLLRNLGFFGEFVGDRVDARAH